MPGKDGLYIETGPCCVHGCIIRLTCEYFTEDTVPDISHIVYMSMSLNSHVNAFTKYTFPDISHTAYMSVLLDSHVNTL